MDKDFLKKRIRELDHCCYERNVIRYTDFLDISEQAVFLSMQRELETKSRLLYGGHKDPDRSAAVFLPDYMEGALELYDAGDMAGAGEAMGVVSLIEARPLNDRFSDELSHRDFLGAIMNLGIERSKVGDILTDGSRAFIFVISDIADYLAEELRRVKHTSVSCQRVGLSCCDIEPAFSEERINVASERADAVVAAVFRLSRDLASRLIGNGNVFSDGMELKKASAELRDGARISVRGYGKFIYRGMENVTRKGRLYVLIDRYV